MEVGRLSKHLWLARTSNESNGLSSEFDCRLPFQFAPTDDHAFDRGQDRSGHYIVHHLAVAESLKEEPPQEAPLLALFQKKSERRRQGVHHQKQRVVKKH